MIDLIKKQSAGFYAFAAAAVIALVALILAAVSSATLGYAIDGIGFVIAGSIIGILLIAGGIYLANRFENRLYTYATFVVAMVLFCICFTLVIMSRTYLMGTLWVTALDSTNALAVSAMNTGAASFVLYALAMIACVVGGFFKVSKQA